MDLVIVPFSKKWVCGAKMNPTKYPIKIVQEYGVTFTHITTLATGIEKRCVKKQCNYKRTVAQKIFCWADSLYCTCYCKPNPFFFICISKKNLPCSLSIRCSNKLLKKTMGIFGNVTCSCNHKSMKHTAETIFYPKFFRSIFCLYTHQWILFIVA